MSGKGHLCTSRLTFASSLAWGQEHPSVFIWQSDLGQRASVWHQIISLQGGWYFWPMETQQCSCSMSSNSTSTPQSHKSLSLAGWGRWKLKTGLVALACPPDFKLRLFVVKGLEILKTPAVFYVGQKRFLEMRCWGDITTQQGHYGWLLPRKHSYSSCYKCQNM